MCVEDHSLDKMLNQYVAGQINISRNARLLVSSPELSLSVGKLRLLNCEEASGFLWEIWLSANNYYKFRNTCLVRESNTFTLNITPKLGITFVDEMEKNGVVNRLEIKINAINALDSSQDLGGQNSCFDAFGTAFVNNLQVYRQDELSSLFLNNENTESGN